MFLFLQFMQEMDKKFVMIELEILIQIHLGLEILLVQKYLKEMIEWDL